MDERKVKKKRMKIRRKRKIRNAIFVAGTLLIVFLLFMIFWKPVKRRVELEVGTALKIEQFLKKEEGKGSFVTNIDEIDTGVPGEHKVLIKVSFRKFKAKLSIVDTVPPSADAKEVQTLLGRVPSAEDCVENIQDMTGVTIVYKEEPDVSKAGETEAVVLLTDEKGNAAEVEVPIQVIVDKEAPVIIGVKEKEVVVGGTLSYRQGIAVSDDLDENPELTIDNSAVDLDKVGSYEVVYIAVDDFGNTTTETGIIRVIPRDTVPEDKEESENEET